MSVAFIYGWDKWYPLFIHRKDKHETTMELQIPLLGSIVISKEV